MCVCVCLCVCVCVFVCVCVCVSVCLCVRESVVWYDCTSIFMLPSLVSTKDGNTCDVDCIIGIIASAVLVALGVFITSVVYIIQKRKRASATVNTNSPLNQGSGRAWLCRKDLFSTVPII